MFLSFLSGTLDGGVGDVRGVDFGDRQRYLDGNTGFVSLYRTFLTFTLKSKTVSTFYAQIKLYFAQINSRKTGTDEPFNRELLYYIISAEFGNFLGIL